MFSPFLAEASPTQVLQSPPRLTKIGSKIRLRCRPPMGNDPSRLSIRWAFVKKTSVFFTGFRTTLLTLQADSA